MNTQAPVTDYGDLLASLIEADKAEKSAKRLCESEAAEAARARRVEILRPFITILQQAKTKFPRAGIYGTEGIGELHFYTEGNTRIVIEHEEESGDFTLRRIRSGYGQGYSDRAIASSKYAEDLIPKTLELLVPCVQFSQLPGT